MIRIDEEGHAVDTTVRPLTHAELRVMRETLRPVGVTPMIAEGTLHLYPQEVLPTKVEALLMQGVCRITDMPVAWHQPVGSAGRARC